MNEASVAPESIASVEELFGHHLPERFRRKPDVMEKLGAVIQFEVIGAGGGQWVVDCRPTSERVYAGRAEAPSCTICCSDQVLLDLVNGRMDGLTAVMTGKLELEGDAWPAMLLGAILGEKDN